jgi:hypothetical protein
MPEGCMQEVGYSQEFSASGEAKASSRQELNAGALSGGVSAAALVVVAAGILCFIRRRRLAADSKQTVRSVLVL